MCEIIPREGMGKSEHQGNGKGEKRLGARRLYGGTGDLVRDRDPQQGGLEGMRGVQAGTHGHNTQTHG